MDAPASFFGEIGTALKRLVLKVFWTLQSRKFWAAVGSVYASINVEGLPEWGRAVAIAAVAVVYMFTVAWEDVSRS